MGKKKIPGTLIRCGLFMSAVLPLILSGCANGIVGKDTNKNIKALNSTIGQTTTAVTAEVDKSRDKILDYLEKGTRNTSRDISIGILQGTIGYLDSAPNREALMTFIDELIVHTAGGSRKQLVALRNQLLDPDFVREIRQLAHALMHELAVQPANDLVQLALSKSTRDGLDGLLRVPIPAILNDSAIRQLCKLRECLLGVGLRGDVAALVDTALWVTNRRLDTPLRHTILEIVHQAGNEGRHQVNGVLYVAVGGAILIILVLFGIQEYRLYQKRRMLFYITNEIEKFRKTSGEANFKQLTGQIRETMLDKRLEGSLRRLLYKEGINKTP